MQKGLLIPLVASTPHTRVSNALLERIRGEYREMPGLRLTLPQACRLWQLDAETCEAVLHLLIAERFLSRTPANAFIALSATGAQR